MAKPKTPTVSLDAAIQSVVTQTAKIQGACGDTVLLSFSGGKESIALLGLFDELRLFRRVIPYYLYLVPRLDFVENALTYYERRFGVPIIRLPHPSRFRMLNSYIFQPPGRLGELDDAGIPDISYHELEQMVRQAAGDPRAFVAIGVRARDSLNRWANYKKTGGINWGRHAYHPIAEWTVQHLDDYFTTRKIPLPIDYQWFGRSFDGLDYRFVSEIRRHSPRDYQRILEDFPLVELEIFRRERMEK
jgi:3'-phosphoadenosine 5'-phosphosulfate sulfotransferase (PAPS reductase)/FAD synthetase